MNDIAPLSPEVEEKTADQVLVEDLMDKIEGLTADLDAAIEVAVSRGAVTWAELNYPGHPALDKASAPMKVVAAAGMSALQSLHAECASAAAAATRSLEGHGPAEAVFDGMESSQVQFFKVISEASAAGVETFIAGFMPETREGLNAEVRNLAKKIALAERNACLTAVGKTVAPVVGTPYSVGPRKFTASIAELAELDLDKVPGLDLF